MLSALLLLQAVQGPVRTVPDPGVIATNQKITPAGAQSVFTGRVTGLRFGKQPDELWVAVPGSAYRLGWAEGKVLGRTAIGGTAGVYGLALDPVANQVLVSLVGRYPAGVARPSGVTGNPSNIAQLSLVRSDSVHPLGSYGTDMAGAPAIATRPWPDGHRVAVFPLPANDRMVVIDVTTGMPLATIGLGVVPLGAVISSDGSTAWVTEMAGKQPAASDRAVKQCCVAHAEAIRVDPRGIALSGSVSKVDLVNARVIKRITVGLHPTAVVWDEAHSRLFVADGNSDQVSIIDTQRDSLLSTLEIAPFREHASGLSPTALAISPDGATLFVALGGANAVAVYDLSPSAARPVLRGMIPTSWYPSTLDVSPDGRHLAIGSLFGVGSGAGRTGGQTGRYVHAVRGAVNVVEIPSAAQLAAFSVAVAVNNRWTLPNAPATATVARRNVAPRAVPERPGEPSLIQHVVYVVKENRTYDQILGDLGRGDGDPSLVMYGRDITPNQHALAEQYVVLDRFFASGGNSADGHQWLTQANETEYTLWPLYEGRSYPYDGTDPLAYSSGGFIWDAAASKGKSVAVFGEFAPEITDTAASRVRYLADYKERQAGNSATLPTFHQTSPIPSLDKVLVRDYPTWTLTVPDVVRAEIFNKYLAGWQRARQMPNLVIVQLPSNHTNGTGAGWCTPKACVADNDLALGQIVDAISHSEFWSSTAILVVEDDAQAGVDHVDGHRTVALAVSPYTRKGSVDSTFYNHPSLLKTIELMLGLPSLSMFDLVASDLSHAFIGPTEKPDVTPFTSIMPTQSIYEQNPRVTGLRGAQLQGALASARMNFSKPDAAPTDKLNQILWHDARGWNVPYPKVKQSLFFPMSLDLADEDRDEVKPMPKKKPR